MVYSLHDRILGSLIGAAVGDGMGAATEARTTQQIIASFGSSSQVWVEMFTNGSLFR